VPSPTLPFTDPSCLRDNAADGLDLLSSNSLYVVATGSGHEIHLFQPEVVVRSLDRALVAIRSGIPLSSTLQGLD
jgi:hypothetical protein